MKPNRSLVYAAFLFIALSLLTAGPAPKAQDPACPTCGPAGELEGCTVIMVGKAASTDGSVMTTHTCDCGECDWTWRYIPAADHKPGEARKIWHISQFGNWAPDLGLKWEDIKRTVVMEIPELAHTRAYIHGDFGYMNDAQVAIGESTVGCQPKMENPTPAAKFDITMLTLIAMERAGTAREAIKIMGELGEKYGYGHTDTGEMLAVADPKEVWVFEIMPVGPLWTPQSGKPGAVWAAQRVPDDHVSVCPNESRIGEIDLKKPDYFMASPNVVQLATDMKFFDPKAGQSFNWKKAYNPTDVSAAGTSGARVRLWRFLTLVAPSQKFSPETLNEDFPFSVKPEKKLSARDVMMMTRDKTEGTPYWPARGIQGGPFQNPNYLPYGFELEGKRYSTPRIIGVNRAEYVTVTQSRGWLPDPIGGLVWLAWGAQDTSCFMPLYAAAMDRIPRSFEVGDHWTFDRSSARWAFDYVDFHTQVAYNLAIEDVRAAQKEYEDPAVERTDAIDKAALDLYKKDPALAAGFLTDYCLANIDRVLAAWWQLGDDLLVKYNHMWVYDKATRKRGPLKFPDWWLKLLVEYNQLTPVPAAKK
jgi:dipeptidase